MNTSTFRQGDPVTVGWSIGRAPLALRGIRFAEGEGGAPPAGPAGGEPTPPAGGSPADVAAMLAALGKAVPPATPPAPTPPAQIQGFTPEQVQKLMADNTAAQKVAEDAQAALAVIQKERDEAQAQLSGFAREKAVSAAAGDTANAALLLDSASFQAAIKDLDVNDTAALTEAVKTFVTANPLYAAGPTLPGSSGGTPTGGTPTKPTTLEGAVAAALGG